MISCKKDETISIDNLSGEWNVIADANVVMDGSITYTFEKDGTCLKRIYNALSNKDSLVRDIKVVLSYDNTLITLYNGNNHYTEQYRITKLTGAEMNW
ncbi:hypothetical protein [Sphingobacterium hungaricum]